MDTLTNERYLIHRIKFCIALTLQIPAIIICLLIFTFFILHQRILRKLQHQALLLLFIVNFIQLTLNLPMAIDFYRLNRINPPTITYCKWWTFLQSTLDAANEFLVTTIAIQRHILIFQSALLNVRRTRYLIYYSPLLACITYPFIFYMFAVVFYPCDETQWDFTDIVCGDTTCFLASEILATYDWVVDVAAPMFLIILSNTALLIRVIKQKHRRQQVISWAKQRRMTLQLLSISSLYLIIWLPSIIVGLIQQLDPTDFLHSIQDDYISDLTYLICVCLPWISIGLVPKFKQWIVTQFNRLKRQHNVVRPE